MPELPEVETVRRVLVEELINKKIESVEIRYSNIVVNEDNDFISSLKDRTIIDIKRYGKYLIFCFDKGYMLSHLRMEGKYFYVKKGTLDNKHIHVIFHLENGYDLLYQDVRKFGRMHYVLTDPYQTDEIQCMGPDLVLSNYSIQEIYNKIHSKNKEIKALLLDQSIVAGLGNIYVDEVLYKSHIKPTKKGKRITKNEVELILTSAKEILLQAIECKGTTIRSYTSSLGVEGTYQNFLQVHTKNNCPNCNRELIRVKIDTRMTYYCNTCQR